MVMDDDKLKCQECLPDYTRCGRDAVTVRRTYLTVGYEDLRLREEDMYPEPRPLCEEHAARHDRYDVESRQRWLATGGIMQRDVERPKVAALEALGNELCGACGVDIGAEHFVGWTRDWLGMIRPLNCLLCTHCFDNIEEPRDTSKLR